METLLLNAMYGEAFILLEGLFPLATKSLIFQHPADVPGSNIRYVLVTREVALGKVLPLYFKKDDYTRFLTTYEEEESLDHAGAAPTVDSGQDQRQKAFG